LSAGGKEVLIKSVAQAIPVYSMACFRLPRGLCEHINSLIRGFWWGSKEGKRKPHWVSWQVMTSPKYMGGLGFRDLELFNLALLARQGWRLLQDPSSLSARILKAVYFPSTSFLDAELGSSPSQIWRSILDGREVLKQGITRRIGNGRSTPIWSCNWIPREPLLRPLMPLVPNPPQMVHELINHTEAAWNTDLVRQVFLPMDADAILSIPLCTRIVEDFWAWHFEKRGIFSVRSAYRMLVETKIRRENWLEGAPGPSSSEEAAKTWTKLWKMSIPSKLKIFVWRFAHQSIPSADVLHHRKMATTSTCSLCGSADSWRHSLLDCMMARCTWALADANVAEHMILCSESRAKQWLFFMHDSLSHDEFTRMIVTLWAIWTARRKAIHDSIFQSPEQIHRFVESYLFELGTAYARPERVQPPSVRDTRNRWVPSTSAHAKINVDGAFAQNGSVGAATAFCRNEKGDYLGASALVVPNITDPTVLEALACREGLSLAEDLNLSSIHLATDCQGLVEEIKSGSSAQYGAIIQEIQTRHIPFTSCFFTFESRTCNFEAHSLAKHASSLGVGRHLWLDLPYDQVNIPVNILQENE
jgi:hypothetical protein